MIAWLVGVVSLVGSHAGATWLLQAPGGLTSASPTAAAPASMPAVVGVGHVDVEGGVSFPYPTSQGRVVEVPIKEGQAVRKDDVLFRLDDFLARQDLAAAERAVRAAVSQLNKAKNGRVLQQSLASQQSSVIEARRLEIDAARIRAARLRENAGIVPGVNIKDADAADKGIAALGAALAAEEKKLEALQVGARDIDSLIEQAEIDLEQKKALIEKAQYGLNECVVKAKCDGTILRLTLQAGDILPAQPRTPPLIFCPSSPRIVRAEIEQEWAGRVDVGQVATIEDYTSNGSSPVWKGRVTRAAEWMAQRRSILPDPGQFHDVRTLECVVSLDPGQPPLRIGQRVRVTLSAPQ